LEIRFHKRQVSFLVVKTAKCKQGRRHKNFQAKEQRKKQDRKLAL